MDTAGLIRVLIVDDSPTVRALLAAILSADPDLRVVGEADCGAAAVEMTKQLRPDIVTMDIHMPGFDGYRATEQIMIEAPTPIVIISGQVDVTEVSVSMRALRAGALALAPRPPGPSSPAFDRASGELVRLVKAMAGVKVVRRWPERAGRAVKGPMQASGAPVRSPILQASPTSSMLPGVSASLRARRSSAVAARAVAIAASTGGPAALHRILSELPLDFRVPMLIVQHMAPGFIEGLASWLSTASPRRVKVAEDGEPLRVGLVYMAPDDRHLGVSPEGLVRLADTPHIEGFRPSGSFLFNSVAASLGSSVVGVVLTGMGHDGLDGLRSLRMAGGVVIAQDEETSVVFGMPGAAVAAGVTDLIVPLHEIAAQLTLIAQPRAI